MHFIWDDVSEFSFQAAHMVFSSVGLFAEKVKLTWGQSLCLMFLQQARQKRHSQSKVKLNTSTICFSRCLSFTFNSLNISELHCCPLFEAVIINSLKGTLRNIPPLSDIYYSLSTRMFLRVSVEPFVVLSWDPFSRATNFCRTVHRFWLQMCRDLSKIWLSCAEKKICIYISEWFISILQF